MIKPALIISFWGTQPKDKTIAFGGVPAGIINPKDAAFVAGSKNKRTVKSAIAIKRPVRYIFFLQQYFILG